MTAASLHSGLHSGPAVFIYVQHLLGVGHLSRALALSQGLVAAGCTVTLASGGFPAPSLPHDPQLRWVQLPPVRARDATFAVLENESGHPITDAWRETRRHALMTAYAAAKPQVLITELYPFGRRMMAFELLPLLSAAKTAAIPPLIVASVRDILATPKPDRMAATVDLVRRFYDLVLVHGDPKLIPLTATFPAAESIDDLIAYTGYIDAPSRAQPGMPDQTSPQTSPVFTGQQVFTGQEVLISAGGGAVALPIIKAVAAARPLSQLKDRPWRCRIAAHELAEIRAELGSAAAGLILEPPHPDFAYRLRQCAVSLSRAGYNTVVDILSAQARAVLVPFAAAGETEQEVRAEIMAHHQLMSFIREENLSPARLAAALDDAAAAPTPAATTVDLSGRATSAHLIRRAFDQMARS